MLKPHDNAKLHDNEKKKKRSYSLKFIKPVVSWEDNVDARRRAADVLNGLVVHLPDGVGEGTGRVDYGLRFDVPFLTRQLVLKGLTAELKLLPYQELINTV